MTRALVDRAPRTLVVCCLAVFAIAGVILWGVTLGGASPQLQRPLSAVSGDDADVANAFLPVAFNLAIFAAGILGAAVLSTLGELVLPLAITVFGLLSLVIVLRFHHSIYPTASRPSALQTGRT